MMFGQQKDVILIYLKEVRYLDRLSSLKDLDINRLYKSSVFLTKRQEDMDSCTMTLAKPNC